jgi:hypothetical protein
MFVRVVAYLSAIDGTCAERSDATVISCRQNPAVLL